MEYYTHGEGIRRLGYARLSNTGNDDRGIQEIKQSLATIEGEH